MILFSLAVVSSAVHYTDNTINWAEYPHPEPGSSCPIRPTGSSARRGSPSRRSACWACGGTPSTAFSRPRLAIAVYSVSGTISIGHYLAPGATDMAPLRQVSIGIDIVLGALLLGLALWAALKVRPSPASRGTAR